MALRDIFVSPEQIDMVNLHQGDILQKTSSLTEVIAEAHKYYAEAETYHFFMVLTQSCDLVRRGKRGAKARYITIAAMRPASIDIERLARRFAFDQSNLPLMVCRKDMEIEARKYLEKLLNNTEDGRFFIRKGALEIFTRDYCVFLPLSIALRIEHYDACINAKVAQLTGVFQAKVGWLTSNMYGRVGTPDLSDWVKDSDTYKKNFYEEALYARTVWLTPQQYDQFKAAVQGMGNISEQEQRALLADLKTDVEMVVDNIVDLLSKRGMLTGDDQEQSKRKASNLIKNAPFIRKLFR